MGYFCLSTCHLCPPFVACIKRFGVADLHQTDSLPHLGHCHALQPSPLPIHVLNKTQSMTQWWT